MISDEVRARIRRLFYAEHWKVGTIAAELNLHADTVKRAIESERFASQARPVRPVLLEPYKPFIAETLKQYPRLRATRLYEMIRQRGYPGSVVQLRRYIKTVRPESTREAYLRLETMPGEQAQVDWGHFGTWPVGAGKRTLSCFVMVLSFCRALFARFFLDQRMESFLRGHVEAFHAFGGIPRVLLYDNLKSVVIERDGELIRYHPKILEMAGHYHFEPQPCTPYRGNEKGKVERTIQYIRHSFFAARNFSSLEDLNSQLRDWTEQIAHIRPVPGNSDRIRIVDALAQERERLLPLPEHPFPTDHLVPVRSGKTPYIRYDKNDYSIPHSFVRQPLTVVASETRLRILDQTQTVIAEHTRSYDYKQRIEDPEHLRALAKSKATHHARGSAGQQRLMAACPYAAPFFAELCARNEPFRPHTVRLGRLLDAYGREELDAALAEAIHRGAISAASVAHLLNQRRRAENEPPPLPTVLPDDPRVHTVRITPHALAPYDELTASNDTAHEPNQDCHRGVESARPHQEPSDDPR